MFAGSLYSLAAGSVFTALLIAACVTDLRSRRIPNSLVLALAITGVVFVIWRSPVGSGVLYTVKGFAVGLLIWLPFWLLGVLGAGDVKLFAASAIWLGPVGAIQAALLTALVGGVLALGWLMWRDGATGSVRTVALWIGSMRATRALHPVAGAPIPVRVPYGLAMSAGALLIGWLPGIR